MILRMPPLVGRSSRERDLGCEEAMVEKMNDDDHDAKEKEKKRSDSLVYIFGLLYKKGRGRQKEVVAMVLVEPGR